MNFFKDFIMPPLVLAIICIVVTTSLVATESITTPIITQQKIEAANKARGEVMSTAKTFEKIAVPAEALPEGAVDIYKADGDAGYVVTGSARGYGGIMKVMVGISPEGAMTGAKVLEQSETKGLGTKVTEPAFINQFVGETVDMKSVEMISGVTVSSRAFMNSVKSAYMLFGQVAGIKMDKSEPARDPLTLETVQKLFPTAAGFTRLDTKLESYKVEEQGFIVVTTQEGFVDNIVAAIGYDKESKITGIVLTQLNETPDYGTKIADPAYLAKFVGKTEIDPATADVVSGATISSNAFIKIVKATAEAMPEVKTAPESASLKKLTEMMAAHGMGKQVGIQGAKYAIKSDMATGLVMVTEGFGGEFEVIVITDNSGTILQVALGKSNETDGYGSKAAEPAYTDKYTGKTNVDEVESISGATVTSMSFRSAVKRALEIVKGA